MDEGPDGAAEKAKAADENEKFEEATAKASNTDEVAASAVDSAAKDKKNKLQ